MPLFIFQLISATRSYETLMGSVAHGLESQSVLVASEIERYLRQTVVSTKVLALSDVFRNKNAEKIRDYIRMVMTENSAIDAIGLVSTDGMIQISTAGKNEEGYLAWDIHLGVKELFAKALTAKESNVFVSEAHLSGSGPEIIMVVPIVAGISAKVISIVLIETNIHGIEKIVTNFGQNNFGGKQTYVIDKFGRVIVTTDQVMGIFSTFHDVRDQPAMLGDFAVGTLTYTNRDNVEVLAGYADMTQTGINEALDWSVITVTPVEDIIRPARKTRSVLTTTGLFVASIAVLIAYLFARSITLPLRRTVTLAEEIRQGNYSHRLEANIGGEIGLLADAINEMADRVEERTAEIITRNEKLTSEIVERKLAQDRLKKLSHKIVRMQEEERRRVSRELHDGINQLLVSVKFKLESFEQKFDRDVELDSDQDSRQHKEDSLQDIKLAEIFLDEAISEVRRISHALRPSVLDDLGLSPAISNLVEQFADRNAIDVESSGLEESRDQRLPADVETAMYRIVQEALMNIEKHANATKVSINMSHTDTNITIRIEDNGEGFNLQKAMRKTRSTQSMGLRNMRERIELLQGTFFIHSDEGKGTFLEVKAPLNLE